MVLMEKSSEYDDTNYKFSFLVKIMKLHCFLLLHCFLQVFQLSVITFEKSQGVQIVFVTRNTQS